MVVVHFRGDAVADKHVIIPLGAPDAAVDIDDAADTGAAVRVLAHDGRKAESVMRFAKARVMRAANELVDRRAVAVGAVKIAAAIPAEAEGIHLTAGVAFDLRAIRTKTKHVAAVEFETTTRNIE